MNGGEDDNARHKREEEERRAKRKVRENNYRECNGGAVHCWITSSTDLLITSILSVVFAFACYQFRPQKALNLPVNLKKKD